MCVDEKLTSFVNKLVSPLRKQHFCMMRFVVSLHDLTYNVSTPGELASLIGTGIPYGTMEWKMEWNNDCTQLQLTRVTGTAQSRSNYLVYL